jgi:hypothetical protein
MKKKKSLDKDLFQIIMVLILMVGGTSIIMVMIMDPREVSAVQLDDDLFIKMVSGTEYRYGDLGQVIIELRNRNYQPIVAECQASILYPDKTYYIENENMTGSTVFGSQYKSFEVPSISGIYEYSVNCTYIGKEYKVGKSFHVTETRIKAWTTH